MYASNINFQTIIPIIINDHGTKIILNIEYKKGHYFSVFYYNKDKLIVDLSNNYM